MYYKEGDWESVLFPCLSVRLAIVYFFLLFHISDADNPPRTLACPFSVLCSIR